MKLPTIRTVYISYGILFLTVVTGFLPRECMLAATMLLAWWMLASPIESGVLFFVQSIPLFVALPLTASFDNLNMWRPLSLLLLLRYLSEASSRETLRQEFLYLRERPLAWLSSHRMMVLSATLLILAVLSLGVAAFPVTGIVRILYYTNLSMVPVVLFGLVRQRRLSAERIIESIGIATMVVIVAGFIQLISTYLLDVYQFMRLWGEGIQLRQFGTRWSSIVVSVGNTWLAYYGNQLSLRVFSLFPDSHSFPTFLLLGIPALLASSVAPILRIASTARWGTLVRTYAQWSVVWVPAGFLAAILSGTRGIWAASIGVIALVPLWAFVMRRMHTDIIRRRLFVYAASYLALFFVLFSLAWPIFVSPQFLVGKGDANLLAHRLRSVIDFGETSNALRIEIWKASWHSIRNHPLLGVGIGNFPVVLGQDISLARAGSTAHNLYIHVASEMGLPAAVVATLILMGTVLSAFRWFSRAHGSSLIYAASLLLYLPWVYAYVMTDPILFDERVFLLWASTIALVFAHDHA